MILFVFGRIFVDDRSFMLANGHERTELCAYELERIQTEKLRLFPSLVRTVLIKGWKYTWIDVNVQCTRIVIKILYKYGYPTPTHHFPIEQPGLGIKYLCSVKLVYFFPVQLMPVQFFFISHILSTIPKFNKE